MNDFILGALDQEDWNLNLWSGSQGFSPNAADLVEVVQWYAQLTELAGMFRVLQGDLRQVLEEFFFHHGIIYPDISKGVDGEGQKGTSEVQEDSPHQHGPRFPAPEQEGLMVGMGEERQMREFERLRHSEGML